MNELLENFKLWSEQNGSSQQFLKPDLGMRSFNELSGEEKNNIWAHLKYILFEDKIENTSYSIKNYIFYNTYWLYGNTQKQKIVTQTIAIINDKYKVKNFCPNYLKLSGANGWELNFAACNDFLNIFKTGDEQIVYEALSIFFKLLFEKIQEGIIDTKEMKKEEIFESRVINIIDDFNDVFNQFGINYMLSIKGFIPRQEERIMDIYVPILKIISENKYKEINRILGDAFNDFRKSDYSGCLTHTYSFLQGYLQIKISGEYQEGDISKLIPKGIKDGKLPDDFFTTIIFKNIESIFSRERQEKGDAHPKTEYANEKTALLLLNLAMIFVQHSEK